MHTAKVKVSQARVAGQALRQCTKPAESEAIACGQGAMCKRRAFFAWEKMVRNLFNLPLSYFLKKTHKLQQNVTDIKHRCMEVTDCRTNVQMNGLALEGHGGER